MSGVGGEGDGFQRLEVEFLGGVVDVNADDVAFRVEIDDQAFGHLARIGAGPRVEVDVKLIGFPVIVQLHAFFSVTLMVA